MNDGQVADVAALRIRCLEACQLPASIAATPSSCLRPTNPLKVPGTGGLQILDATFDVSRCDVGVEIGPRARGRREIPVTRQRVGRNGELLSSPGACHSGSGEQFFRHLLFVEISFADDEEVAGRVVARCGVSYEPGVSQLVDVPVAVDGNVIGDIDPPLRVMVVSLVLADATRSVAVVAEDHRGVVELLLGWGSGACRRGAGTRTPGLAAQHDS